MPHTNSAKKKLKQNNTKRLNNRTRVSALKTETKKLMAAINAKDSDAMDKHLPITVKLTDKVAAKGIIKKNTASRRKSRLMKRVNQAKAETK